MFETRIIFDGQWYFVDYRYTGSWSLKAMFNDWWPPMWERWSMVPNTTIEGAKQFQANAMLDLMKNHTSIVVNG